LDPITDRPLAAEVVSQLNHLPRAATVAAVGGHFTPSEVKLAVDRRQNPQQAGKL
jgi:hypothetical protein